MVLNKLCMNLDITFNSVTPIQQNDLKPLSIYDLTNCKKNISCILQTTTCQPFLKFSYPYYLIAFGHNHPEIPE